MSISVTPLHPHLGAEVAGVDLTQPVPPAVFAQIEAAFNRHAVLVFRGQPVTDEQQMAFSRGFGPLETMPFYTSEKRRRLRYAEMSDISNLDADGNPLAPDSPMHRGRPYDEARYRRVLHRTTVSDEINSVERERRARAAAV